MSPGVGRPRVSPPQIGGVFHSELSRRETGDPPLPAQHFSAKRLGLRRGLRRSRKRGESELIFAEAKTTNIGDRTYRNPYSALRKWTHRSTTSKPSASCARCDPSWSSQVSDAISRQPRARAQSSAAPINSRPTLCFRNLSCTNHPSTKPTGWAGSHPSAWERIPTSRNPVRTPSWVVRYENGHRQSSAHAMFQGGVKFLGVLFERTIRPQQCSHCRQFGSIGAPRLPYHFNLLRFRSFRGLLAGPDQPISDSMACASAGESASSRLARSCFIWVRSDVPVSGSMPMMRAKPNTTWAGVAFAREARSARRG